MAQSIQELMSKASVKGSSQDGNFSQNGCTKGIDDFTGSTEELVSLLLLPLYKIIR
jgi:hypothetical protein